MRERPIIFDAESVRAILDGRKTQTRRVIVPQPPTTEAIRQESGATFSIFQRDASDWWTVAGPVWAVRELMDQEPRWRCPYGRVGDTLWIKEPVRVLSFGAGCAQVLYEADGETRIVSDRGLPSTLRMVSPIRWPKHLVRHCATLADVRLHRVQEISEEDVVAEGIPATADDGRPVKRLVQSPLGLREFGGYSAKLIYQLVWGHLNAKRGYSWESNPWVWALTFRRLQQEDGT